MLSFNWWILSSAVCVLLAIPATSIAGLKITQGVVVSVDPRQEIVKVEVKDETGKTRLLELEKNTKSCILVSGAANELASLRKGMPVSLSYTSHDNMIVRMEHRATFSVGMTGPPLRIEKVATAAERLCTPEHERIRVTPPRFGIASGPYGVCILDSWTGQTMFWSYARTPRSAFGNQRGRSAAPDDQMRPIKVLITTGLGAFAGWLGKRYREEGDHAAAAAADLVSRKLLEASAAIGYPNADRAHAKFYAEVANAMSSGKIKVSEGFAEFKKWAERDYPELAKQFDLMRVWTQIIEATKRRN